MKRQSYYPTRIAEQVQWLENFVSKIAGHLTTLGYDPAVATEIIKDARWVIYTISPWLTAVRAWGLACTQAAKMVQFGSGGLVTLPAFTPPVLPAGVVARSEGALNRIFDLVADMKEKDGCGDAMCADLRIVGSSEEGPDFATLAPEISVQRKGNVNFIDWGWGGYGKWLTQCEIQVDRGQGWETLTFDTTPGYNDTHPVPATLTMWKYRAIYRVDDEQVGQWSPIVSIAMGG